MRPDAVNRWHVVYTRANAEEVAAGNLLRQGFTVFLPRYRRLRSHARRVETVIRPLFPRYLFVALSAADQWRRIHSTVGVASLLCQDEHPVPVQHGVVEALQARTDTGGVLDSDGTPPLAVGDRVRLLDGSFADQMGRIERLSAGERVAVLLEVMGRSVRVMLSNRMVERAA